MFHESILSVDLPAQTFVCGPLTEQPPSQILQTGLLSCTGLVMRYSRVICLPTCFLP